jgi:hypothetical protein
MKKALRGVFAESADNESDCTALLIAHDESGRKLDVRSPIESEIDVVEFAETAKVWRLFQAWNKRH